MCTPDLEYIFDTKPSTQTEFGCSSSIEAKNEQEQRQKQKQKLEEVEIQTDDEWDDDAEVGGTSAETEASEAEEEEDEEAEDEETESTDTIVDANCMTVTTENGESIQFLSFISNGERKVRINDSITLPLDVLRDHLDDIDLSLDRLVANDNEPVISNTLLAASLIFIYVATFTYFYLIYINMPPL
jgi:cobalamin biosynthesis protein CobT